MLLGVQENDSMYNEPLGYYRGVADEETDSLIFNIEKVRPEVMDSRVYIKSVLTVMIRFSSSFDSIYCI